MTICRERADVLAFRLSCAVLCAFLFRVLGGVWSVVASSVPDLLHSNQFITITFCHMFVRGLPFTTHIFVKPTYVYINKMTERCISLSRELTCIGIPAYFSVILTKRGIFHDFLFACQADIALPRRANSLL